MRLPTGWPGRRQLPVGWRAPLLSEVAERASGHTPDKKVPDYWDGDVKWLSLSDCRRLNRVYVSETSRRVSQTGLANSSARLLPAGVVVLSRDAGVGQSAITTCPMAVSQHFLAWRCSDELDPHFLYYWFQRLRPELERIAAGSTIKTIGLSYFDKLRVPVPPLDTQRRLSAALLALDEHVDCLERLAAAKTRFRCGLVQRLLSGQRRFAEFTHRPWTVRRLGELLSEKAVPNTSRSATLVYSCTKTLGIVPQATRFGKRIASSDLGRYKVVEPGDLVYDPMLLWDASIGFVPNLGQGVVSPAYETFTLCPDVNRDYLWPLLKSYELVQRYRQISRGTNTRRKKAHPRDFLRITVPWPSSKAEQDRIASVLATALQEIELIRAERAQIDLYKRALFEQFLTSDARVPS